MNLVVIWDHYWKRNYLKHKKDGVQAQQYKIQGHAFEISNQNVYCESISQNRL